MFLPKTINGVQLQGRFGGLVQPIASITPAGPPVVSYPQRTYVDVHASVPIPWVVSIGGPQQGPIENDAVIPAGTIKACEANPDPCNLFAVITFGSEGADQVVQVDVGMGCRVPVFGSHVRVDIACDIAAFSIFGPDLSIPSPCNIPVGITPFASCAPVTPLMRTVRIPAGTIAALGTSAKFSLPPFTARVEHAYKANGAAAVSRTVRFYSRNAAASATEYLYAGANRRDPSYPEWTAGLPVPWNASKVEMTNNDAALAMNNPAFLCQLQL